MINKILIIFLLLLTTCNFYAQDDEEESRDLRGGVGCEFGFNRCVEIGISQVGIEAKNIENSLYLILPQKYFTNEQEDIIRDPEQAFFFHIQKYVILLDETLETYNIDKEFNVVPSGRYPVEFSDEQYKIKVSLNRKK